MLINLFASCHNVAMSLYNIITSSSFTLQGCRKVVLSTNIAETSVTIPGVKYVVDTGMVKARWVWWVGLVCVCAAKKTSQSLQFVAMQHSVAEVTMVMSTQLCAACHVL